MHAIYMSYHTDNLIQHIEDIIYVDPYAVLARVKYNQGTMANLEHECV